MHHLIDDPLPNGLYDAAQAAIIRYAQRSTRLQPIDDDTYGHLKQHFSDQQIIDLCLTVGLSNMVNRFHATFHTDVDESTLAEVASGNTGESPIALPKAPDGAATR